MSLPQLQTFKRINDSTAEITLARGDPRTWNIDDIRAMRSDLKDRLAQITLDDPELLQILTVDLEYNEARVKTFESLANGGETSTWVI